MTSCSPDKAAVCPGSSMTKAKSGHKTEMWTVWITGKSLPCTCCNLKSHKKTDHYKCNLELPVFKQQQCHQLCKSTSKNSHSGFKQPLVLVLHFNSLSWTRDMSPRHFFSSWVVFSLLLGQLCGFNGDHTVIYESCATAPPLFQMML